MCGRWLALANVKVRVQGVINVSLVTIALYHLAQGMVCVPYKVGGVKLIVAPLTLNSTVSIISPRRMVERMKGLHFLPTSEYVMVFDCFS